jgi:TrkA domain protein
MSPISESNLPGVGRKFQVETNSGDRLIIVIHDDGHRELYHYNRKNLEKASSVLTLTDGEARQIAGIIGGLTYVPKALASTELVLDDLVLEWFTVETGARSVGKTIADMQARTRSGAAIVSIIEPNNEKHVNPLPGTVINAGATLIIAGDRTNLNKLKKILVFGDV